ncbi:hypothetical protein [Tateyamaria sp. ANG-S1]|uniref:hypothetical protein n=1 Tax=Tateyamaria sp. ANG-S1 TaxID=1577905 RepID=UPI00057E96CC|nr:hypothetical protein [Tateyamaria sp. ANG-S1]KIC49687.1 hypothetical protein RA29_08460 [Tateyamaria sp. ANG-S1]
MIEITTGVQPGAIAPQYRVLNATDAALVWVLKWGGDADHVIANKLDTMPSKVADILAENTHVGSKDQATKMVAQSKD